MERARCDRLTLDSNEWISKKKQKEKKRKRNRKKTTYDDNATIPFILIAYVILSVSKPNNIQM